MPCNQYVIKTCTDFAPRWTPCQETKWHALGWHQAAPVQLGVSWYAAATAHQPDLRSSVSQVKASGETHLYPGRHHCLHTHAGVFMLHARNLYDDVSAYATLAHIEMYFACRGVCIRLMSMV